MQQRFKDVYKGVILLSFPAIGCSASLPLEVTYRACNEHAETKEPGNAGLFMRHVCRWLNARCVP